MNTAKAKEPWQQYGKAAWAVTTNGSIVLTTVGATKYHAMALALVHSMNCTNLSPNMSNADIEKLFKEIGNKFAIVDGIKIDCIPVKVTIA